MPSFSRVALTVSAIAAFTTGLAEAQQPNPNDPSLFLQWYLYTGGANHIGLGLTGPTGGWQYTRGPRSARRSTLPSSMVAAPSSSTPILNGPTDNTG